MNFRRLSAAVTATIITLIPGYSNVQAAEPDYLCFLTTNSGEVVDLSESLCHSKKSKLGGAKTDKEFIEEYKSRAMKYPDVRDNLIASIENSPESDIERAKGVCTDLKAGLSLDEIQEDQGEENAGKAGMVKSNIITNLASKYYCPEMSN